MLFFVGVGDDADRPRLNVGVSLFTALLVSVAPILDVGLVRGGEVVFLSDEEIVGRNSEWAGDAKVA